MCRDGRSGQEAIYNPMQCPFTVRQLNSTTFVVRENDRFGEFPHIYVKLCTQNNEGGEKKSVLVINDTGVGTNASRYPPEPPGRDWNIANLIEQDFNPNGDIPYLVILSHCHYDHILGLEPLLRPKPNQQATTPQSQCNVTILSSSHAQSFATPYKVLMEHSLCASENLHAPTYETAIWAEDDEPIIYKHPLGGKMHLPIMTLHTPGHTPDSLSWYDTEERALYVGDSFYEQESTDTRHAPWGPEGPAPILFPNEGSLVDWWRSLEKLVVFVEARNKEERPRVKIAAGHVTAGVDAGKFLGEVKDFMVKVLREETHFEEQPMKRGERFGRWTHGKSSKFSLGAPLRVIKKGREAIPEGEYRTIEQ